MTNDICVRLGIRIANFAKNEAGARSIWRSNPAFIRSISQTLSAERGSVPQNLAALAKGLNVLLSELVAGHDG